MHNQRWPTPHQQSPVHRTASEFLIDSGSSIGEDAHDYGKKRLARNVEVRGGLATGDCSEPDGA